MFVSTESGIRRRPRRRRAGPASELGCASYRRSYSAAYLPIYLDYNASTPIRRVKDKLEMKVHEEEIVLRPLKKTPREGWRAAFEYMHKNGEDSGLLGEFEETEELEWEWK